MAYSNPRMSIVPNQQQSRTRKKEEDPQDAFMRLTDKEIVGCITDIGIPFTMENLKSPNPVQVQMILEWFAELLLNATRATVEPAMRAAADDVYGEYSDTMPPDTRNLMGFYASLRNLLAECGVRDFGFNDLYKPTHPRLVKIFSYLINFVRFRESQTNVIDDHYNRGETAKQKIETLYSQNSELEERLAELKANRRDMEVSVREKTTRNEEFKKRLLELNRTQGHVTTRLEETKQKRMDLQAGVEEKTTTKIQLKQEATKLRPYATQSPGALQESLADLTQKLNTDKAHIDSLDRRARALQTSADSFSVVSTDVASCIKILDEIGGEISKEEEEMARNIKQRDALSERGNNVRDYERQETMLRKQLAKWNERTEKLREQSREYVRDAKEKMERFRTEHHELTREQATKSEEIEKRRVRIEQSERKMLDLKENVENEIHAAYEEYLKLEAHIKLYITEMENAI
ncbi:Nuf2 family protein [Zalerion maritima]|uniref:Probable kinetochore protein NUF2 n=1 Tax=Zalerion maritima TaxID=339359 RepID=A0AAD5S2L2_9PEZI|nr:Nuf2 family protein [Zalerion maritima]